MTEKKRMKKIKIILVLAIVTALLLTGCNKQILDFQYDFDAAIVTLNGESKLYRIDQWTDYQDGEQLQLTLQDGSVILVSTYNTILVQFNSSDSCILWEALNK